MQEHIRRVEPDSERIASLAKICAARLKVVRSVVVDDETASIVAADYYEIIKELLVALLLRNGLKSDNHECLVSFFKNKFPQYEYEAKLVHQLKDVRNRVSYDGVFVKRAYVERNKLEFEYIISLLNGLATGHTPERYITEGYSEI